MFQCVSTTQAACSWLEKRPRNVRLPEYQASWTGCLGDNHNSTSHPQYNLCLNRWTWLLLGIVLLLILLVLARAYCSWKGSPKTPEKRMRRSCSREVKRERLLTRREEEEVDSCYVPPPPMTSASQPRMSWQGSPLPSTQNHKLLFPECPPIPANVSNVKTGEKEFVPVSPNVCNPGNVGRDTGPEMIQIPVETRDDGSRNSVYVWHCHWPLVDSHVLLFLIKNFNILPPYCPRVSFSCNSFNLLQLPSLTGWKIAVFLRIKN